MNENLFSLPDEEYREVALITLATGEKVPEDLFLKFQGKYLLFAKKGQAWKIEDSQKIKDFGAKSLYIRCDSEDNFQKFVDQKLTALFESPQVSTEEKAKVLYATTHEAVKNLFETPESLASVRRSVSVVRHCVNFLAKDRRRFYELFQLAAQSKSEHAHAIHVAAYSISLARIMGYRNANDLIAIGLGALLHDIGKSKIDQRVLQKKGELSLEDRRELQRHVEYGYQLVSKHPDIPELACLIVLQHHERPSGRGYPFHLKDDIHIFSKIVSVCEVFDSLTGDRPYRKAVDAKTAIKYLISHKDDFDQAVLINFIRMLEII